MEIKRDILTGKAYIEEAPVFDFSDQKVVTFAKLLASGFKVFEAYKMSGFEGETKQAASEMLQNEKVIELLKYFKAERGKMIDITEKELIYNLACIATYNPKDFFNDDGTPKLISELTDAQARAIVDINYEVITMPNGAITNKTKFKFGDKMAALKELIPLKQANKQQNKDRKLIIGVLEKETTKKVKKNETE